MGESHVWLMVAAVWVCATAMSPGMDPAALCIDGRFDDWKDPALFAQDREGDATGAFDLVRVAGAGAGTQLYVQFEMDQPRNLQSGLSADGTLRLLIGLSSKDQLEVNFRERLASAASRPGERVAWTAIKFACLPTYAGKQYELRLDLESLGVRVGDTVTLQFAGSDSLAEPLQVVMNGAGAGTETQAVSTTRPDGTLRVANLNTLHAGLSDPRRATQITRLLKAVEADVCCFQEELEEQAFRESAPRVVPHADGKALNVHWRGDCGIATSLPLQPLDMQFEPRFSRTDPVSRQTGAAAAIQLPDGRYVVVCSVHWSCCGYQGDVRDQAREREARRVVDELARLRAGAWGDHLRDAPVIVVGDYNLVGSRAPLDTLEACGLSECLVSGLVDNSACTWRGPEDESFWPGRLDLVTFDATRLLRRGGFILNSGDLPDSLLDQLGLQRHDSEVSDHLLIVTDFAFPS